MCNYSPGLSGAPLGCQLWRTTWQAPLPHALHQMFLVALPQGILWPSHTPLARICVRLGCGGEVQQCPSLSSGRALRRSVGALKLLKFYYSFWTSPSWLQPTISFQCLERLSFICRWYCGGSLTTFRWSSKLRSRSSFLSSTSSTEALPSYKKRFILCRCTWMSILT